MSSDRGVEWFRRLVGAQQWDYVVLWKLGNDPSRFIEWMGCCCSGGCESGDNVKEENSERLFCRDINLRHSVSTKACESLAQLPASMPLYSGVHTEVVMSRKHKWLNQVDDLESNPSNDCVGTRVLIPVEGGLIELYTRKHIAKDQKVLDLVLAHCKIISLEQETTGPNEAFSLDSLPRKCKQNSSLSLNSLCPSLSLQAFSQVRQSGPHTSIEGSPSTSNSISYPCNKHLCLDSNFEDKFQYEPLKWSSERSSGSKKVDYNKDFLRQEAGKVPGFEAEKSSKRVIRWREKGNYKSTNLLAERDRRKRIRNGLLTLRSLVPKITKMDMASILGDAINYIRELQMQEKELRDKITEMSDEEEEDDDCQNSRDGFTFPEADYAKKRLYSRLPLAEKIQDCTTLKPKLQNDVQVNQIGERMYFIKLFVVHKRGGFVRLLEAMDSLKLHVVSTNLTTINGRVQNIFEIKGEKDIQPKKLRDLLIELTG